MPKLGQILTLEEKEVIRVNTIKGMSNMPNKDILKYWQGKKLPREGVEKRRKAVTGRILTERLKEKIRTSHNKEEVLERERVSSKILC